MTCRFNIAIIFFICLILASCNMRINDNNDISILLENNELKWGMDTTTVRKLLKKNYSLSFLSKEVLLNNVSYIYLGGSFSEIKMKGVKLLFENNAFEGMEIWIDSKSKEEMEGKYSELSKYFSRHGEIEFNASNDAWRFFKTVGNEKKSDTDIFMLPQENKILIHIHKTYVIDKELLQIK